MSRQPRTLRHRGAAAAAAVLALSLLASACGGTTDGSDGTSNTASFEDAKLNSAAGEVPAPKGKPVRGGTLKYALESDSPEGYCLPEAQLAISGMMIVRAFYDTLTRPNNAGGYSPYLAKSLDHNADYTEWTIGLRDGITFSDGSKLDATVVKNNLDAYRGKYPTRKPLLFYFVFSNVASTSVVDPLTVKVTMTKPWVAFPAYLYASGRLGMMGQKQLDDTEDCQSNIVGTGPFIFDQWNRNTSITGTRNEKYWQTAPDGKPYPYVEKLELQFKPDIQIRLNSFRTGGINALLISDANQISSNYRKLRDEGKANMFVSQDSAEVSFLQLNNTKPPFDDPLMRKALAMGVDREELNQIQNNGFPDVADGPFAPDSIGYLKDPGFPKYDLAGARKLVKQYVAKGGKAQVVLVSGVTPDGRRFAELLQQAIQKIGIKVKLTQMDGPTGIDAAIGKKYEAMPFRNFPGGDPDQNYVWWYDGKTNPVNFSGYSDPKINADFDQGRSEPDPEKRAALYQDINRQLAKNVYNIWWWYTPWAIVEAPNVHGVLGPPIPGEDASKPGKASTDDPEFQPSTGLATGHNLIGMWIDK